MSFKKNNMKSREEADSTLITVAQKKKKYFVFCSILAGAALGSCGNFSCVSGVFMISHKMST